MLIGLASKSAILIVEFANQQLRAGRRRADRGRARRANAATADPDDVDRVRRCGHAARLRTGAGSAARHSLGTVVFGGMIVSTLLNLAITPVLYVIIKSWSLRRKRARGRTASRTSRPESAPAAAPRNGHMPPTLIAATARVFERVRGTPP